MNQDLREKLRNHFIEETNFLGEITLEVSLDSLKEVLSLLKQAGYEVLMDLTAVDYLIPTKRTKLVYLLHHPVSYERMRITAFVEREQLAPSVTDLWEGANWYERELWDLFGIHFEGHPELKRILMPDDWKGHPLQRDYALTEEPVTFKHGVKPKIPSETIPYVKDSHKKPYGL